MPTVDVRITSMYPPGEVGSIRGYASATIDSCLAIRGIKVVEGGERGLFVSMPRPEVEEALSNVALTNDKDKLKELYGIVDRSVQGQSKPASTQNMPWRYPGHVQG